MKRFKVVAGWVSGLAAAVFLLMYGLYRYVFCFPPEKRPDVRSIPNSRLYRQHRTRMLEIVEKMEQGPYEEVSVLSQDGLRLYGKLYYIKNAFTTDKKSALHKIQTFGLKCLKKITAR